MKIMTIIDGNINYMLKMVYFVISFPLLFLLFFGLKAVDVAPVLSLEA